MYLLHTERLTLLEFFGSKVPPYVILSHLWGDEEVSFEQIRSGHCTNLAGYRKIQGCCSLARKDGWGTSPLILDLDTLTSSLNASNG